MIKVFKQFIDNFQIHSKSYVSVVGSGGKSTLIKQMAMEASSCDWPSVITTTTHIHIPFSGQGESLLVLEKKAKVEEILPHLQNNLLVLVSRRVSDFKAKGFEPEYLEDLKEHFLLLVEADGSKNKPFKIPASFEPVVPKESTHIILVCSLGAIGKPLEEEYVHRIHLLENSQKDRTITPSLVADALSKPSHYLEKFPPSSCVFVYLSGCTDPLKYSFAQQIAHHLAQKKFLYPVFAGNIGEKTWIEKI